MIRAEALFRRFRRTVETIDKKENFPAPALRQRKALSNTDDNPQKDQGPAAANASGSSPSDSAPATAPSSSEANTNGTTGSTKPNDSTRAGVGGNDPKKTDGDDQRQQQQKKKEQQQQLQKVISPELRLLLSREIIRVGHG